MTKHNILITGGNGFVGTQVSHMLVAAGHTVTIVDRDLSTPTAAGKLIEQDFAEFFMTNTVSYDTVIHLAAEHLVEQSVSSPAKYYTNNVVKMQVMLDNMLRAGIKNIMFSSSGNIYGRQGAVGLPLKEYLYYDPQNPYASSKVAGELLIKDYSKAYGLNYVTFRYFNAAGADPTCRFGYRQRPATHVIPILCNKILNDDTFHIYGSDYDTIDGTCVRDYVHVDDLARAHLLAIDLFDSNTANETFNIGAGSGGVSVGELVKYAEYIVGKKATVEYSARRKGDPATLIADIKKAKVYLNWVPQYDIHHAILHAWNWEKKFENTTP